MSRNLPHTTTNTHPDIEILGGKIVCVPVSAENILHTLNTDDRSLPIQNQSKMGLCVSDCFVH